MGWLLAEGFFALAACFRTYATISSVSILNVS